MLAATHGVELILSLKSLSTRITGHISNTLDWFPKEEKEVEIRAKEESKTNNNNIGDIA